MTYRNKIVLNCAEGYRMHLDDLVEEFIRDKVIFIGVAGKDSKKVEDIIDELVVGDGSRDYFILTSSHESLEEAVTFAKELTLEFSGEMQIVDL